MTGHADVVRANALQIPLADESVDAIVTSPPYFALRAYADDDGTYDGQIGLEATPADFIDALLEVTRECIRVLKPTGSLFVNLGDKYAGSGGHNNAGISSGASDKSTLHGAQGEHTKIRQLDKQAKATRRQAPDRYNQSTDVRKHGYDRWADQRDTSIYPQEQSTGGIRAKSLLGLPWRYAIACIDQLGLILRAEIVWDKPNGLPESVSDRARRSHEQWFHFVKQGRYYSCVDEIRTPTQQPRKPGPKALAGQTLLREQGPNSAKRWRDKTDESDGTINAGGRRLPPEPGESADAYHPLGRLPGSVWSIASEPLKVSKAIQERYNLPDHFAAFPTEWPRRLILGWTPPGYCTACGEARRPYVERAFHGEPNLKEGDRQRERVATQSGGTDNVTLGRTDDLERKLLGYVCACTPRDADGTYQLHRWEAPETKPAVVLDPFGGTGTVAMVARTLGRHGISLDLSAAYCRLAEWRINHSGHGAKALSRTWSDRQGKMV